MRNVTAWRRFAQLDFRARDHQVGDHHQADQGKNHQCLTGQLQLLGLLHQPAIKRPGHGAEHQQDEGVHHRVVPGVSLGEGNHQGVDIGGYPGDGPPKRFRERNAREQEVDDRQAEQHKAPEDDHVRHPGHRSEQELLLEEHVHHHVGHALRDLVPPHVRLALGEHLDDADPDQVEKQADESATENNFDNCKEPTTAWHFTDLLSLQKRFRWENSSHAN